jgi:hypothetical protein
VANVPDVTIYDEAGNPAVVVPGASIAAKSFVLVSGSDGANAWPLKVDTAGKLYGRTEVAADFPVHAYLHDKDGVGITSTAEASKQLLDVNVAKQAGAGGSGIQETGFTRVAGAEVVSSVSFRHNFQSTCRLNKHGPTATTSIVDRRALLDTGTGVGQVSLVGRERFPLVGGGTYVGELVLSGDAANANNIRKWGVASVDGIAGHFFRLNGTALEIAQVTKFGITTIPVANWSEDNSVTWDTGVHTWAVHVNIMDAGRILFSRDGKLVHVEDLMGTPGEVGNANVSPRIESTNTAAGTSVKTYIHRLGSYYEGDNTLSAATKAFRAWNEVFVGVPSQAFNPILGMRFRADPSFFNNFRGLQVRKIRFSNNKGGQVRIKVNPQFTGTLRKYDDVRNPNAEWTSFTSPFTATVSGTNATGTGYSDGDTTSYQVTATGPTGETLASTAVAAGSVGTPKKQVDLVWSPITFASGYNIYRQLNGSGTYDLIKSTPLLTFTDDAHTANTSKQPPVSNNTEGDSQVDIFDPPTTVVGGRIVGTITIAKNTASDFSFSARELILYPGESLSVEMNSEQGVADGSAEIEWEEVLY